MVLQNYPALWCAVFIILDDSIWEKKIFHGIAQPFIYALVSNKGQYNMQHKTQ